mgnify:CR=1 FL=1
MKYKAIGITALAVILVLGSINWQYVFGIDTQKRYHQHWDAPQKTPCKTAHAGGELCTHLPIISINTGGKTIPGATLKDENGRETGYTTAPDGSDRITAYISTFDNESEFNHPTDASDFSSKVEIHIRGNSSRSFDKPGYAIKLITEDGKSNPYALLGMDEHQDWVLHGPFIDKTLIRNYMWYNIAGEIMDYAPNVRFCEVMLNGEYRGVYVLAETITAGKNDARLNLTVDEKNNNYSGYALRLDRGSDNELKNLNSFSKYTLRTKNIIDIVYPGTSLLTPELTESIRQDFSSFEKMLYSYDFDNPGAGYEDYIDVESFIDFFLINEFTCNYDAGWLSTYIYKDMTGKFRMCIWDFNSACDNYQDSYIIPNHLEMQHCLWYVMLIKDEDFTDRIIKRYKQLRKTYFSEEYLNGYIDDCIEYLGDAIERNFRVWGYTFKEEHDVLKPAERNARSYDEAVKQLKDFLRIRTEWLDENIETVKQYSKESKVKKFIENAN